MEINLDTALEWFTEVGREGSRRRTSGRRTSTIRRERYEEAFTWFTKAANQGDIYAEYNLGICYENGNGVKRNVPEAVKWFTKAAEKGHPRAAENARRLIDAMA